MQTPCSLLRIPVQAVIADCIPTLTGAVLTSPIRVTFGVATSLIRVGRVLFPVVVLSVGTRSLSISAAPLELDMLAIVTSCFPGSWILSGPMARTVWACRATAFSVKSLVLGAWAWVERARRLVRKGLTWEVGSRVIRLMAFRARTALLPLLVLGFTLTS